MEIVVLSRAELIALWVVALVLPPIAHLAASAFGKRLGVPPPRAVPRILVLTFVSVATLLWLTETRFSSLHVDADQITIRYAPPAARAAVVAREEIADVFLRESRFPHRSYSVSIRCEGGDEFRSVGVTPERLGPLYDIFEAFRPGETPCVALR